VLDSPGFNERVFADDSLYPIALLVEEMKSEDTEVRINAMRQLRKIAAALGADRTRKELIPFLNGVSTVLRGRRRLPINTLPSDGGAGVFFKGIAQNRGCVAHFKSMLLWLSLQNKSRTMTRCCS